MTVKDRIKKRLGRALFRLSDVFPDEIVGEVRKMSDKELFALRSNPPEIGPAGAKTPRNLQIKAIAREIKRRGLKE